MILPAFGVSIGELAELERQGCTLVDTTCGSVLNVWKNVRRYAQDGFTSVIHGKVHHEETRATASQATQYPDGHFLIVRDEAEADARLRLHPPRRRRRGVHRAVRRRGLGRASILPRHLERDRLREPDDDADERVAADRRDVPRGDDRPVRRGGARRRASARSTRSAARRRSGRTPSSRSSTQQPLDLAVVIGGYNSSNTCNLARICAERVPTFHIAEPDCLVSADRDPAPPDRRALDGRRRRTGQPRTGCPAGPVIVGLTAGASTPNNIVGQVIERLEPAGRRIQGLAARGANSSAERPGVVRALTP